YLGTNKAVASFGMSFGTLVNITVLIVSALIFLPRGIRIEHYDQVALALVPVFGYWGFVLFCVSLAIACFGAAQEISLEIAYFVAQGFGWNWGENQRPAEEARFSLVYTIIIFLGM